jgi:hypothetical protein
MLARVAAVAGVDFDIPLAKACCNAMRWSWPTPGPSWKPST